MLSGSNDLRIIPQLHVNGKVCMRRMARTQEWQRQQALVQPHSAPSIHRAQQPWLLLLLLLPPIRKCSLPQFFTCATWCRPLLPGYHHASHRWLVRQTLSKS
jgi:hypothetical protein